MTPTKRPIRAKGRRSAMGLALLFVALAALPATGATVSLQPPTQTVDSGQTASWGGAWGDTAPYDVTFAYGDGTVWQDTVTYTSKGWSRTFVSCINTSYTQELNVVDGDSTRASATAITYVKGGICR